MTKDKAVLTPCNTLFLHLSIETFLYVNIVGLDIRMPKHFTSM